MTILDRLRAFAKREPLIVRTAVTYLVLGAAWAAARYAGVEFDTEAVVVAILGALGVTGAVVRDGVYSPASVELERQRAAEEALINAPTGRATVVQVGGDVEHVDVDPIAPPPPKPSAGLAADWADIPTRR